MHHKTDKHEIHGVIYPQKIIPTVIRYYTDSFLYGRWCLAYVTKDKDKFKTQMKNIYVACSSHWLLIIPKMLELR